MMKSRVNSVMDVRRKPYSVNIDVVDEIEQPKYRPNSEQNIKVINKKKPIENECQTD